MNYLAITAAVSEGAVSHVSDAATEAVSGTSVTKVASEVVNQVSENIEQATQQTNVFLQYVTSHIPDIIDFGINILIAVLIFVVGKKLIRLIRKLVRKSLERADADLGVIQFLDACAKTVLYFILVVIIVGRFGIQASSMIAILGSAGLAVGLALQGSLANFAGGVLILLLKPFRVGDYIIASEEGTVSEIHVFYTKLITVDNKLIFLPNGNLANGNIINVTAQDMRRVDLQAGIGYSSDLKLAKKVLTEIVSGYEKRLTDKEVTVFVDSLEDSAVTLGARIWVRTEDYWDAKWTLTEQIKIRFDEEKIEIPFNQLDVHMR